MTGDNSDGTSRSTSLTSGAYSRRHASPSRPRDSAVRSQDRIEERDTPTVEGVGDGRRREHPFHAAGGEVERSEERRGDRRRVDRRAEVMDEARQGQLGGSGAAAGRFGGLVDPDGNARPGQGRSQRRGRSVRPRRRRPRGRRSPTDPRTCGSASASNPARHPAAGGGRGPHHQVDRCAVAQVSDVPPLALADRRTRLSSRRWGRSSRGIGRARSGSPPRTGCCIRLPPSM